jgi:hypothetical protein
MVNLTDRFVRSVQCADGKRTDFADDKVKSLWLRVTPQGTRSWSILYRRRSDSKLRRLTIGQFPASSLHDARVEAQVLLGKIARGETLPMSRSGRARPEGNRGPLASWANAT